MYRLATQSGFLQVSSREKGMHFQGTVLGFLLILPPIPHPTGMMA